MKKQRWLAVVLALWTLVMAETAMASAIGAVSRPDKTGWAFSWDCIETHPLDAGKAAKEALLNMGYEQAYSQPESSYSHLTAGVVVVLSAQKMVDGDERLGIGFGAHESSYDIAKARAIEDLTKYHWSFSANDEMTIEHMQPFSCTAGETGGVSEGNWNGTSTAPYAPTTDDYPDQDISVITPDASSTTYDAEFTNAYVGIGDPVAEATANVVVYGDDVHFMQGQQPVIELGMTVAPYHTTVATLEITAATTLGLQANMIQDGVPSTVATDAASTIRVNQYDEPNYGGYRSKLQLTVGDTTLPVGTYQVTVRVDPEYTYAVAKTIYLVVHDTSWDGTPTCCSDWSADFDKDGVINSEDKFPIDPSEQYDADGDGVGDNADLDDDNDSLEDSVEIAIGTDPLHPDTDHDGLTDAYEIDLGIDPTLQHYQLGASENGLCLLKVAQSELVCTTMGYPTGLSGLTALGSSARLNCVANSSDVWCWGYFNGKEYPLSVTSHSVGKARSLVTMSKKLSTSEELFYYCVLGENGLECYQVNGVGQLATKLDAPDATGMIALTKYRPIPDYPDIELFCGTWADTYQATCWTPGSTGGLSYLIEPAPFHADGYYSEVERYNTCHLMSDKIVCGGQYFAITFPYLGDVDNNGILDRDESLTYLGLYTDKFSRLTCDAGADQFGITEKSTITLAAQNTALNPLATQYQWSLAQGAFAFDTTAFDTTASTISYTTPDVGSKGDTAYIRLGCSNPENGDTNESYLKIQVNNSNTAPVADASATLAIVGYGETVVLDASQSYDEDGDTLRYFWDLLESSDASTILNSIDRYAKVTSFTAPATAGHAIFDLYVSDGLVQTKTQIRIEFAAANKLPVVTSSTLVIEGRDGSDIQEGDTFTISVVASDPDGSAPLQYRWTFPPLIVAVGLRTATIPSLFAGQLSDEQLAQPNITLTAPLVGDDWLYVPATLEITDERRGTTTQTYYLDVYDTGNPDTDGDGVPDHLDSDDDNDGYADSVDLFPYDASDWQDYDGDGVGDNADHFPLDPTESSDSDGDGIGDNSDTDDDADGYPDISDAFPLDPTESSDNDGDGIGDNSDTDDDADGYPDLSDAFPLDSSEWEDADSDGIGNNADNCPFIANSGQVDSDGDGVGDACESLSNTAANSSGGGGGGGIDLLFLLPLFTALYIRRRNGINLPTLVQRGIGISNSPSWPTALL